MQGQTNVTIALLCKITLGTPVPDLFKTIVYNIMHSHT
jgi:hypothetical protein